MASRSVDRDSAEVNWQFGPNFDITLKPILRMKFLNQAKQKYLTFRGGYRYLISATGPDENRMILEFTPRFLLPKSLSLADRNRMDLRWYGSFSWRYRNRLSLEKDFTMRTPDGGAMSGQSESFDND